MESEGVSQPLIHEHVMMPWNNNPREGDCCGRSEAINDGYYCNICDFFVHKTCVEDCSDSMEHPSHSNHTLRLRSKPDNLCDLCGRMIKDLCYSCEICDFDMHLYCAKFPPPEVIDISHQHKLTLFKDKELTAFQCGANCGNSGDGFPYKCHECDFAFHVDCVRHRLETIPPAELNHSCHALHPLKLLTGKLPDYSDGKCRLCERKIGYFFYHCSPCNFTLEIHCALNPPQTSRLDLKTHDHLLTLLPRLDFFTCNACGLKGDRSPYICVQCDFIIHQSCLGLPCLININRHDHRVSRTSLLGIIDSVCGVCHKNCAEFPRKKWHVLHNERLTLITNATNVCVCFACARVSNGFRYQNWHINFDVLCSSVSEPFVYSNHPNHPLYYTLPSGKQKRCRGCNRMLSNGLSCIEDDCTFDICFRCATLPQVVKHRVDDHPLSLCYGEKVSGKIWCDICEKETNPEIWFYTCKDHLLSLHTECVLGDFSGFMPRSIIKWQGEMYEVVLNNSMSRPFCSYCKLHCIFPITLKRLRTLNEYYCSLLCVHSWVKTKRSKPK